MNTPPQRHGAGAGASGDAQVPWVTLEEVGVESEASTMEALRGRGEALSSSPHRSPMFQDTASLDATCTGVVIGAAGKQLPHIAVIVSLSLTLTPSTLQHPPIPSSTLHHPPTPSLSRGTVRSASLGEGCAGLEGMHS